MAHTFNTVADMIGERVENELPDKVLEALRPLDGKPVTKRLLDKLPGGKDEWHLERDYGMTHIKNNAYRLSSGSDRDGISMILDWRTDAFPLDVAKIEENNSCYFKGRKERNHARMEARNNKELLTKMAKLMNKVEAANKVIAEAEAEMETLAGYGTELYPDRLDLEYACGLRKPRK